MKTFKSSLILLIALFISSTINAQNVISETAQAALLQNNSTPAFEELGVLLNQNPKNELALTYRANLYSRTNQFAKAADDAIAAIAINPKNGDALLIAGLSKTALKEFTVALKYFDQALTIDPNYLPALFYRGRSHYYAGNNHMAISDFDKVILLDPKHLEGHYHRASALLAVKKFDLAITDLEFVLKNGKSESPLVKATQNALIQTQSAKAKQLEEEVMYKEIFAFTKLFTELEQLQAVAKPLINAIDKYVKPTDYLQRADAMEKALPQIKKINAFFNDNQKVIDGFLAPGTQSYRFRWESEKQLYQTYERNNSSFDIANYRYSGKIHQQIKKYNDPANYTAAREKNDPKLFEKCREEDLVLANANLALVKEAITELAKSSPEKYLKSKNSYEEIYNQTLKMAETLKNAKF